MQSLVQKASWQEMQRVENNRPRFKPAKRFRLSKEWRLRLQRFRPGLLKIKMYFFF